MRVSELGAKVGTGTFVGVSVGAGRGVDVATVVGVRVVAGRGVEVNTFGALVGATRVEVKVGVCDGDAHALIKRNANTKPHWMIRRMSKEIVMAKQKRLACSKFVMIRGENVRVKKGRIILT